MTEYYKAEDLDRFGEVGKHNPPLFKKFMEWYNAALEPGALTKREKVLIGKFREFLERKNNLDKYREMFSRAFNPLTLDNVMCRHLVNVG